ncbi:hypothetical protein Gpo141_00001735 [Globisporangium polare]
MRSPPSGAASASAQLQALAWICFCGPGLFNALTSFASGLADPPVAFAGNALVYLSFAICSLLAAALVPAIGVRRALSLGATGYFLYAASLWNVRNSCLAPITVYYAACVLLGAAAALLWTAQGLMLLSYPNTETQGASVSRFWIVFNMGATTGGLLSFALNFSSDASLSSSSEVAASDGMYAAFLLLMGCGALLAWLVIEDSDNVVKDDGQPVKSVPLSGLLTGSDESLWTSWTSSVRSAVEIVSSPVHMKILLLLLPLFAYSNWFYAYHSFYNVAVFNARTSGLTSACYWLAQMAGASAAGHFLDTSLQATHSTQAGAQWRVAKWFLTGFLVLATVMWTLGWYVQSQWLHLSYDHRVNMDVLTSKASTLLPALLLYIVYGLHDALCQVWLYWFMSLVTAKDVVTTSCYTGIYKSIQAASAALAWYLGAIQMDPLTQLQLNLVLCIMSVLSALQCCNFALSSSIMPSPQELASGWRGTTHESDKLLT